MSRSRKGYGLGKRRFSAPVHNHARNVCKWCHDQLGSCSSYSCRSKGKSISSRPTPLSAKTKFVPQNLTLTGTSQNMIILMIGLEEERVDDDLD